MRSSKDIQARWEHLTKNEPDSERAGYAQWCEWLGEIKGLAYALDKNYAFEKCRFPAVANSPAPQSVGLFLYLEQFPCVC